jgi:hypothetical protein
MHPVENTTDRLVLRVGSPLFRPFLAGGLGLLVLGGALLIVGPHLGPAAGSMSGDLRPASAPGIGVFLTTFGFFIAIVPLIGRFPYLKEIVVDRAARQFVRRDWTLLRLREETYPLGDVRGIEAEEARHVDGDPYYIVLLRLLSGEAVTLDRFTDRLPAWTAAQIIRDQIEPEAARGSDRAGPPPASA